MPKRKALPRKQSDVGYGKPPVRNQFKPGKSGNPRGRPRTIPDIAETAMNELGRRRKVVVNGKEETIRTDMLLIRRLAHDAAQGKIPALRELYEIAGPELRKARRKRVEYERITPAMTAKEAADLYMKTLSQPSYDDEEPF